MPPPTNFPSHQADEVWVKTEQYLDSFTIPQDEALEFALKNADANGLPRIAVSASQGKLLSLLAKSTKTKRVLEVGTLAGYVVPCLPFLSSRRMADLGNAGTPQSGSRAVYPPTARSSRLSSSRSTPTYASRLLRRTPTVC